MPNYLGLDIGTSSIKVVLYDTDRKLIISTGSQPTLTLYPREGRIEHDPQQHWVTTADCIRAAVKDNAVHGLSISILAESGVALDNQGKPLYPVIAWFNTRSQPQADEFLKKISEEKIFKITGQKAGYSFGAFMFLWIIQNHPHIAEQVTFWLSVPDYILYQLTGDNYINYTQASHTLLFSQRDLAWSDELFQVAGMQTIYLVVAVPSSTLIGKATPSASQHTGLPVNLPCAVGGHDHLCGAFASGGINLEKIIHSSGTSQVVMTFTDAFSPSQGMQEKGYVNYAHVIPGLFITKGGLKAASSAMEWLRAYISSTCLPDTHAFIAERAGIQKDLPVWLIFFHGSGTPNLQPYNRAALVGLTLQHSSDDMLTSFMEGLAFWLRENMDALNEICGHAPESVIAIGGTNQSQLLQLIKASVLNLPIILRQISEPCALGAALLADVGCGTYNNCQDAYAALDYPSQVIDPDKCLADRYAQLYANIFIPLRCQLTEIQSRLHTIYSNLEVYK